MSNKKIKSPTVPNHKYLVAVQPITKNQRIAFEQWGFGHNLILHGCAGTGKTMVSAYLMFKEYFENDKYEKIIFVRSTVPGRDVGFLPGTSKEKEEPYTQVFQDIVDNFLFDGYNCLISPNDNKKAWDRLISHKVIEFISTYNIRGRTWDNSLILVDEFQNMTFQELDSLITRVGEDSRIIFSGDHVQNDLTWKEKSGSKDFMRIADRMKEFRSVEFGLDDIVRSGLVKSYLTEKHKLERL